MQSQELLLLKPCLASTRRLSHIFVVVVILSSLHNTILHSSYSSASNTDRFIRSAAAKASYLVHPSGHIHTTTSHSTTMAYLLRRMDNKTIASILQRSWNRSISDIPTEVMAGHPPDHSTAAWVQFWFYLAASVACWFPLHIFGKRHASFCAVIFLSASSALEVVISGSVGSSPTNVQRVDLSAAFAATSTLALMAAFAFTAAQWSISAGAREPVANEHERASLRYAWVATAAYFVSGIVLFVGSVDAKSPNVLSVGAALTALMWLVS